MKAPTSLLLALTLVSSVGAAQTPAADKLMPGSKVFVNTMTDDFDSYLKSAIEKKKVPVVIVTSRDEAEYEIKGTSDTQKAGAAKKIMLGNWHSDEQASISVTGLKSGEVVYAYSANKKNSAHGKQSSAESCAVHLKDEIEKNGKSRK
jgi:hypothetical protein